MAEAESTTGDKCREPNDNDDVSLQSLVAQAKSAVPQDKLAAVQAIRKILTKDTPLPIAEIIECGFLPVLVECLHSKSSQLQLEAAWIVTNIASGTSEQILSLKESGVIPPLIELLKSSQPPVCEQAVWALGNITGDGSECRDYVIGQGVIDPLLAFVNPETPLSFLRCVTWTLSNLFRRKNTSPANDDVRKLSPLLATLIEHEDPTVKMDVCWTLSGLSDNNIRYDIIVESGVIPKLVPLLGHKDFNIMLPALRTLGNIVTGTDEDTQAVLDGGILPHLLNLMRHPNASIVKEAAWTASNIFAGNPHQIQMVIDANLVPTVIDALAKGEFRTQKEAAWAVSNFSVGGNREQVSYLVSEGAIPAMCNLLDCTKDHTLLQVILDGLDNMLKMYPVSDQRDVKVALEASGGMFKVEKLQQHTDTEVYKRAFNIIDSYFCGSDEEMESD